MKKIPKYEFDKLKKEDRELLLSLGFQINEDIEYEDYPKAKKTSLQSYAYVVETSCKLCRSKKIQVFSMEGVGGLLTSKQSTIEEVEGMTVKTCVETTLTCGSCHDVLKLMPVEELIILTIKAARGDCRYSEATKKRGD